MRIGSWYRGSGLCDFCVWAPVAREVSLLLESGTDAAGETAAERRVPMAAEDGFWKVSADAVEPGMRYRYLLDGETARPDPASHDQPDGVHGASRIVDHGAYRWRIGDWPGIPPDSWVIYELHVGTFTPEGTFSAAISRLADLAETGITAVELMPVARFPGERNWGYDGAYPFAVQDSYGGPGGLKELVDACHERGLAVILDVVYNHLGPEGNYLRDFGPYFTDRYRTPWGEALNFDGPDSDGVRNFFVENALYWLREYRMDGLRLDAVHAIHDESAYPFLRELADRAHEETRERPVPAVLIAESDLNDPRVIAPAEAGGFGMDAQWSDDFHHALHALLTGEHGGYYGDFGRLEHFCEAYRKGFVYDGRFSAFRRRRHGAEPKGRDAGQFVVCIQNHDQVGNRMMGDRLSALVSFEQQKLAAGALLLAPNIPLLFMGQEYGETAPFLYFVSHGDPVLNESVREGRKAEFADFRWHAEPPDPSALETFRRSVLNWELRERDGHREILALYRELLRLRRSVPALARLFWAGTDVDCRDGEGIMTVTRSAEPGNGTVCAIFNFSGETRRTFPPPCRRGTWQPVLDSAGSAWRGPAQQRPAGIAAGEELVLHPHSFLVLHEAADE